MFKSDRVTHKKSHLFNLVREQSCPTPGWKHQIHDVLLICFILLIMISIPYYVIHDLQPINLKMFHSHRIFWGGMRVAKVWVLGIRGLLPARWLDINQCGAHLITITTSSDENTYYHTDRDFFNTNQGGRSWQPFGEGKNGHTNFSQARIYYFRVNASFLRLRKGVKKIGMMKKGSIFCICLRSGSRGMSPPPPFTVSLTVIYPFY